MATIDTVWGRGGGGGRGTSIVGRERERARGTERVEVRGEER